MKNKVILISIDGMRPDAFLTCGNPFCEKLMKMGTYSLSAKSVFPSVTLPCHLSIFLSVLPERHGVTSNIYSPPARPVTGLFEVIKNADGRSAVFYGWDEIRDVARPGSVERAEFIESYSADNTDGILTEQALEYIKEEKPDFVFLYMVETDTKGGHDAGWMSDIYLSYVSLAVDNVKRVIEEVGDEYTVIITADHGGHARGHGADIPEDMTVPMFFVGSAFEKGKEISGISLLDIAPTVADIMGIAPDREWEGKSLIV